MTIQFFIKLLKFGAVGFTGMMIDFGTTWLMKEKLKLNKYLANSTGFLLAVTSNYIWNRLWTFESHNTHIFKEYSTFILISLIGLAINNLVVYFIHGKLKLNFYLSKLSAVAVVTLWNFFMNFLITFS